MRPVGTPYEVLGVAWDADVADIRRAYLKAARHHHPDIAGPEGDERMREINVAWTVLRDPVSRGRLDAGVGGWNPEAAEPTVESGAGRFTINPLDAAPFVPFDRGDDDESWRHGPDEFDPATAPSNLMKFLPVTLMACAMGVGLLGLVFERSPLTPMAVVLGVLALVSFVVAPLVAMGKAAANERHDA